MRHESRERDCALARPGRPAPCILASPKGAQSAEHRLGSAMAATVATDPCLRSSRDGGLAALTARRTPRTPSERGMAGAGTTGQSGRSHPSTPDQWGKSVRHEKCKTQEPAAQRLAGIPNDIAVKRTTSEVAPRRRPQSGQGKAERNAPGGWPGLRTPGTIGRCRGWGREGRTLSLVLHRVLLHVHPAQQQQRVRQLLHLPL